MGLGTNGDKLLTDKVVPKLLPKQVEAFTLDALRAKPVRSFDLQAAIHSLSAGNDKTAIAVDIGGDKIAVATYTVRNGLLTQSTKAVVRRGERGSGYLDMLEEAAGVARRGMLPIGVSYAGPTDGTKIVAGPNISTFIAEFQDRYGGDFANLVPWITVANDAEAGIMAGAVEAATRYPMVHNVIYIINGSGLGGAVLKESMILATEPGHIPIQDSLNLFDQRRPCGVFGATYVCLEGVAASKAGLEEIWFRQRGERRSGVEIAAEYLSGDQMALNLYDNSALLIVHVIKGMATAFNLIDKSEEMVVVGHGGIFHVPGYGERVRAILQENLFCAPSLIFTKDFSANACLDGAAIAAICT